MTKDQIAKYLLGVIMCFVAQHHLDGQTISWGPSIPAVQSDDINTCFDSGVMSFEFTNAGSALTDATIEIQLDTGVYYVPSSFSLTASGGISIVEDDISDLSRPIFSVSTIPSGRQINMTIDRTADCEAMAQNIAGSTFIDSIHVYNSGVEVTYANGIANGTVSYEILYGSLSITSVNTSPGLINIGSSANRSMTITNGAFGTIHEFYVADIFPAGELDLTSFRINPSGINYTIPTSNISTVGDSIIIRFEGPVISAVDGSAGTNGDGDNFFEADESFVLSYDVTPNFCSLTNSFSSDLIGWFGCSYSNRCQITTNNATISLNNIAPSITLSDVLNPRLDFCDTVIYSVTLTNSTPETSPPGAGYAKDVTAILGLRSNHSPIATLAAMTQWGSERRNTRHFINHTLNGFPVTLPSVAGLFGTTIPYLPPDFFTSDPDGPGGLTDVDGDGFYDDLPKDSVLVISYGTYLTPVDGSCGTGRLDYLHWEHIAADISWFNDCDIEMSPLRQEFNYTNHIRDYQVATNINAPANIIDDQNFTVGIQPHLSSRIDCNGGSGITGASMDWITKIVLPPGVSLRPGYDMSTYTVIGNEVTTIDKYAYSFTNFPLVFDCDTWDGSDPVIIPISTQYVCSDGVGVCFEEEMHCVDIEITPQCLTDCVGVNPINFTTERISESWTDNTQSALVDLSDPTIVTNYVYPFDTIEFYSEGVFNDTLADQLYLRVNYSPENGGNIFNYLDGSIEIVDTDAQYGQTNYTFPLTASPIVNNLGSDSYEMIFDLSSYRTSVDPSYSYGQGVTPGSFDADTIKVRANMVLSNTMTTANPYTVDSLRSEFFLTNGAGGEVVCGSWSSELNYEYPDVRAGNNYDNHSGCDAISKRFILTYRANSSDNHPNEYRPPVHIDSAVVIVPEGWTVGNIVWFQNTSLTPADYTLESDGTLTIRRPAAYTDYDKTSTASRSFDVDFIADCKAENGITDFLYTVYYKEFAYLTDPSSHVSRTQSDNNGGVNYTGPSYSIIPVDQSLSAISDTVNWRVTVCNTTSDMDVGYNWLALENDGNQIIVDSVIDVTGGGRTQLITSPLPGGNTFVELDDMNQGVCRDLLIYSCLLYTSPSPRDRTRSRMPSSA